MPSHCSQDCEATKLHYGPRFEVYGPQFEMQAGAPDLACRPFGQFALNTLGIVEPQGINAIETQGGREQIKMAVDSGASETVIGKENLPNIELKTATTGEDRHTYSNSSACAATGSRLQNRRSDPAS